MRIALALAIVLALAGCSRPGGQFLASRGGSATTAVGEADMGATSEETGTQREFAVASATPGPQPTPTSEVEPSPATIATITAAAASEAITPTTVAVLTVDPQDVDSALAELDELLNSLGSAMSAMEQAFEQGE